MCSASTQQIAASHVAIPRAFTRLGDNWWQADRLVNVPLAPELGLFLDKAFYDSYNTRWGNDREPLDLDAFADQIAAFKARRGQGHRPCHLPGHCG